MKKPKFRLSFALLLLMFASLTGSAQTTSGNFATLRGQVTEKGSRTQAVEFATVQVLPQGAVTTTNSKGEFTLERLSPGKVNIKIQFLGMETIDTTLVITAGAVLQEHFYLN